jgi:membrane-associated protein
MENIIENYGLWILPIFFLIDDLGVPSPSGTILFAATVFSKTSGAYPFWMPFVLAITASQLGNALLFFWGRHGAKKWLKIHGHKFFLSRKRLKNFEKFFTHHHGKKTVFLASLVNNVRPFMALVAGSSGFSPKNFFPFNFAGIFLWASSISCAGYFLGEPVWKIVKNDFRFAFAILILFAGLMYFWKFFPREILPGYYKKK